MPSKSFLISFAFSTTLASLSFAESSAEDVKRAAASFDQGRSAYRAESYGEAAENFEAADGYAPSAKALRLAMLSRKEAGQLDRAATLAALAVEKYPNDESIMTDAKTVLDEAQSSLGRVEVTCGDESGDLLLDGKLVHGKCKGSRLIYLTPGSHQISESWTKNREASESVSIEAGGTSQVRFVTPALPLEPAAKPIASDDPNAGVKEEKSGGWSPAIFYTGAAVTAVGVGASIFLGVRAMNEPGKERVKQECQSTDCDLYRQGVENQNLATIAIGATAAVGAFTLVSLFFTDFSGDKKEPVPSIEAGRVRVTPILGFGDGATIGARGSF